MKNINIPAIKLIQLIAIGNYPGISLRTTYQDKKDVQATACILNTRLFVLPFIAVVKFQSRGNHQIAPVYSLPEN